ncbi:MAG: fibronectin type III domain-containing protein [Elusimicrobia bacterium]|nr:fibronectin type III domain-containing protein [Elusimicrobiota bacterium]
MLHRALALSLLVLAGPAWAGKLTGGDTALARDLQQSGGSKIAGGAFSLHSAIGGVGRTALAGSSARLDAGYIPLASQPGSITAITALSKSSGTLELSWTAPGRDGFLGGVTGGAYRVDYSSDSAHVFNTSTYQLEFATNAVPGAEHRLTLTGLLPNTTYYTRIYLADERKFFADDSRRSDEATLAGAPINPVITARSSSTVTISWNLPAGGAAGFDMLGSSTNFGAAGVVSSSRTQNGTTLTLQLTGLLPNTTYFFKVASLNWEGEPAFTVVLATVTINSASPVPVQDLARAFNSLNRTVNVTWTIPPYDNPLGVLVLLSTSPATNAVADGTPYIVGQALSDGSVVKSTSLVSQLQDSGLVLNTTYFYHLFTENTAMAFSVGVSTSLFLDLPPLSAAGLSATPSVDGRQFSLSWRSVTSSSDGTPFFSTATPKDFELTGYEIFRSTSVLAPAWVRVGTTSVNASAYLDTVPDPNQSYAYKVESIDKFAPRDAAMVVDTQRNLYIFASDSITSVKVPAELLPELSAANNSLGTDVVIRPRDLPPDGANGIFKAVDFGAYSSPGNERLDAFAFSKGKLQVALRYAVAGGQVVPAGTGGMPFSAPAAAGPAAAPNDLGMYWHNGAKFVKLFGKVDPVAQTVTVDTTRPGIYEIRALERTSGFHFDSSQITNKAITPNGDGHNDAAVFVFDNPQDSLVTGEIYDLRGGFVSGMTPGPIRNSIQWNGRAGGNLVPGGIYVYVIKAEDRKYTGTVVVVR